MHTLTLKTADEIAIVKAQIVSPPQGGFDIEGIKAALALSALFETAEPGVPLDLEDKHYSQLQAKMRAARWVVASEEVVDLVERCLNAPRKAE